MTFTYGPVELFLVGFEGEVHPESFQGLADLTKTGIVSLLDLVVLHKDEAGVVTVTEVADHASEYGFDDIDQDAVGLAGDEDIADMGEELAPGTSAVIVALEQTYLRGLAEQVNTGGGVVLRYERIPAPVVNAVVELDASS